jgi:hypothetical protein
MFITLTHKRRVVPVFNYAPSHTDVWGNILNVGHKREWVVSFTSCLLGPHTKDFSTYWTKSWADARSGSKGVGGVPKVKSLPQPQISKRVKSKAIPLTCRVGTNRVIRCSGSNTVSTIGSQMVVRLSAYVPYCAALYSQKTLFFCFLYSFLLETE